MNPATISALASAVVAVVGAVGALIKAFRTDGKVAAHIASHSDAAAPSSAVPPAPRP